MGRKLVIWVGAIVLLAALSAAALYAWLVPGLSSARAEPPAAEVIVATWLLHHSVPTGAKLAANPVGKDPADITAGRDLYRQKCELCHAYDGSGKTGIGAGQYPHPPALRSAAVEALSDGEIFYHIRNGIRNTAMPAWGLPDREIWQLVSYIRDLPQVAQMTPDAADTARRAPQGQQSHYVGSAACKSCHENVYARWQKTLMANVVRDPREHPDAIIPDLSKPDPLVKFTKDDIALVYGSIWKQRYFTKVGDDYFRLRRAVGHHASRSGDATSSPTIPIGGQPFTPPITCKRPTGPLCDGCHSVNYNISTQAVRNGTSVARNAMAPATRMSRSHARQHRQPARFDTVASHRRLHPVPLPGPAPHESDPRQVLRLADRIRGRQEPRRLLEARGAQARRS